MGNIPSSYSSNPREDESWRTVSLSRFNDDGYVSEWHKRNDLATFLEKEGKKQATGRDEGRHADNLVTKAAIFTGPTLQTSKNIRRCLLKRIGAASEGDGTPDDMSFSTFSTRVSKTRLQKQQQASRRRSLHALEAMRRALLQRTHVAIQRQRVTLASEDTQLVQASPSKPTAPPTKLTVAEQLGLRLAMGLLDSASAATGEPLQTQVVLKTLLPLLDELTQAIEPSQESMESGVLERIGDFLAHVFDALVDNPNGPFVSPDAPYEQQLSDVMCALITLSLRRGHITGIVTVLHKMLCAKGIVSPRDVTLTFSSTPLIAALERLGEARGPYQRTAAKSNDDDSSSGTLYAWGQGQQHGKLGLGVEVSEQRTPKALTQFSTSATMAPNPTLVSPPPSVVQVSCFANHVLAVDAEGTVWSWGAAEAGRLGHAGLTREVMPRQVAIKGPAKEVASGNDFSVVLMESGAVYTFGGETKPSSTANLRAIAALASVRVAHVACGGFHSLCISEEGALYSWGKNQKSQLGLVGVGETVLEPTRVVTLEGTPIKQVCAGWEHTLAVSMDGRLFSWGGGYENKPVCGHGPAGIQQTPKVVETLVGHEVVMAAAGWDHSLAVTTDGVLFTWGDGISGKLGHGDLGGAAYPKRVMGITRSPTDQNQAKVVFCHAGESQSCAITQSGMLWVWGGGSAYELGNNSTATQTVPVCINLPNIAGNMPPVRYVCAGGKVSFAISGLPPLRVQGEVDEDEVAEESSASDLFSVSRLLAHPNLPSFVSPADRDATQVLDAKEEVVVGEKEDEEVIEGEALNGKQTLSFSSLSFFLLAHMDRLLTEQRYSPPVGGPKPALLHAPFCIQATRANFTKLFALVRDYSAVLLAGSDAVDWSMAQTLVSSFRILKANLSRAVLSGVPLEELGFTWDEDGDLCIPKLQRLLLSFVNSACRAQPSSTPSSPAIPPSSPPSSLSPTPNSGSKKGRNGKNKRGSFKDKKPSSPGGSKTAIIATTIATTTTTTTTTTNTTTTTTATTTATTTTNFTTSTPSTITSTTPANSTTSNSNAPTSPRAGETCSRTSLVQALAKEAIDLMRSGIEIFYASNQSKVELLDLLLDLDTTTAWSRMLAPPMLSRLSQDRIVSLFVPPVLSLVVAPALLANVVPLKCQSGHVLVQGINHGKAAYSGGAVCDVCRGSMSALQMYSCPCQYDLCPKCYKVQEKADAAARKRVATLTLTPRKGSRADFDKTDEDVSVEDLVTLRNKENLETFKHQTDSLGLLLRRLIDSSSSHTGKRLARLQGLSDAESQREAVAGLSEREAKGHVTHFAFLEFLAALQKHSLSWMGAVHQAVDKSPSAGSADKERDISRTNLTGSLEILNIHFGDVLAASVKLVRSCTPMFPPPLRGAARGVGGEDDDEGEENEALNEAKGEGTDGADGTTEETEEGDKLESVKKLEKTGPKSHFLAEEIAAGEAVLRSGRTKQAIDILENSMVGVALPSMLVALTLLPPSVLRSMSVAWEDLFELLRTLETLAENLRTWQSFYRTERRTARNLRKEKEKVVKEAEKGTEKDASKDKRVKKAKTEKGMEIASTDTPDRAQRHTSTDRPRGSSSTKDEKEKKGKEEWMATDAQKIWLFQLQSQAADLVGLMVQTHLDASATTAADTQSIAKSGVEEQWLSNGLLRGGLSIDTFDNSENGTENIGEGEENKKEDEKVPLMPGSKSAVVTVMDVDQFCAELVDGDKLGGRFYAWITSHVRSRTATDEWLDRAARATFSATLRHAGLLVEAVAYARILEHRGESVPRSFTPAAELLAAYRHAQVLRTECLRRKQSIKQEILVADPGADVSVVSTLASRRAAEGVVHGALFLMRIAPSCDTVKSRIMQHASVPARPSSGEHRGGRELWQLLRSTLAAVRHFKNLSKEYQSPIWYKDVRAFVLQCQPTTSADVKLEVTEEGGKVCVERLERLMRLRTEHGAQRLKGLQRLRSTLQSLQSPTSRSKVLVNLSQWLFDKHVLDGIDGADNGIIASLRAQFAHLLCDVVAIARDPAMTVSARVCALNVFVFHVRPVPEDMQMLAETEVLPVLLELLNSTTLEVKGKAPSSAQVLHRTAWDVLSLLCTRISDSLVSTTESPTPAPTSHLAATFKLLQVQLAHSLHFLSSSPPSSTARLPRTASSGVPGGLDVLSLAGNPTRRPTALTAKSIGYHLNLHDLDQEQRFRDFAGTKTAATAKGADAEDHKTAPVSSEGSDFTLALWLYVLRDPSARAAQLIALRGGDTERPGNKPCYHPLVLLNETDNKVKVAITTSAATEIVVSAVALPSREWVHLVVALRDRVVLFFVNGVACGSKALTAAVNPLPLSAANSLHLGRTRDEVCAAYPTGFEGYVCAVKWFGCALSARQVQELAKDEDRNCSRFAGHHFFADYAKRILFLLASIPTAAALLRTPAWFDLLLRFVDYARTQEGTGVTPSSTLVALRLLSCILDDLDPAEAERLFSQSTTFNREMALEAGVEDVSVYQPESPSPFEAKEDPMSPPPFDESLDPKALSVKGRQKREKRKKRKEKQQPGRKSLGSRSNRSTPTFSPMTPSASSPQSQSMLSPMSPMFMGKSLETAQTPESGPGTPALELLSPSAATSDSPEPAGSIVVRYLLRLVTALPSGSKHAADSTSTASDDAVTAEVVGLLQKLLTPAIKASAEEEDEGFEEKVTVREQWNTVVAHVLSRSLASLPQLFQELASATTGSQRKNASRTSSSGSSSSSSTSKRSGHGGGAASALLDRFEALRAPLAALCVLNGGQSQLTEGGKANVSSDEAVPVMLRRKAVTILSVAPSRQTAIVQVLDGGASMDSVAIDMRHLGVTSGGEARSLRELRLDKVLVPVVCALLTSYQSKLPMQKDGKKGAEASFQTPAGKTAVAKTDAVGKAASTPGAVSLDEAMADRLRESMLSHVMGRLVKALSVVLVHPENVRLLQEQGMLQPLAFIASTPLSLALRSEETVGTAESLQALLWRSAGRLLSVGFYPAGPEEAKETPVGKDTEVKEPTPLEKAQAVKIASLSAMGISENFCRKALERNKWDANQAAAWVFENMSILERERKAEEASIQAEEVAKKQSEQGDSSIQDALVGLGDTPDASIPDEVLKEASDAMYAVQHFPETALLATATVHAPPSATKPHGAPASFFGIPKPAIAVAPPVVVSEAQAMPMCPGSLMATLAETLLPSHAAKALDSPDHLVTLLDTVGQSLVVICARQALARMLTGWPAEIMYSLTPTKVGSSETTLRLLKLLAFRTLHTPYTYDGCVTALADDPGEADVLKTLKTLLVNDSTHEFSKVLVEECIKHFRKAATPLMSSVQWGARSFSEMDNAALLSSRVEMAAAFLRTLLMAAERGADATHPVILLATFKSLALCLQSASPSLKEHTARILSHILTLVRIKSAEKLPDYLACLPRIKLGALAAIRLAKERDGRVLHSSYLASLLELLATTRTCAIEATKAVPLLDTDWLRAPSGLHADGSYVDSLQLVWDSTRHVNGQHPDMLHYELQICAADIDGRHYRTVYLGPATSFMCCGLNVLSPYNSRVRSVLVDPPDHLRTKLEAQENVIHSFVSCDGDECGVSPIKGIRFKCATCKDFDLCAVCHAKPDVHDAAHTFVEHRRADDSDLISSDWSKEAACHTLAGLRWSASEAVDAGVSLTNSSMTATFTGPTRKWWTVLGQEHFSSGTHTWELTLDTMTKGSIFAGVALANCNRSAYVGMDTSGYSIFCREGKRFFQNKRVEGDSAWKDQPCKAGDTLRFTLNCDQGTLTVYKNNVLLGLAFESLPKNTPLYPAVSFHMPRDCVTIQTEGFRRTVRPSPQLSEQQQGEARLESALHHLTSASGFVDSLTRAEPLPFAFMERAYSTFLPFCSNTVRRVITISGMHIKADTSVEACGRFGVVEGQVITTADGNRARVIGVEEVTTTLAPPVKPNEEAAPVPPKEPSITDAVQDGDAAPGASQDGAEGDLPASPGVNLSEEDRVVMNLDLEEEDEGEDEEENEGDEEEGDDGCEEDEHEIVEQEVDDVGVPVAHEEEEEEEEAEEEEEGIGEEQMDEELRLALEMSKVMAQEQAVEDRAKAAAAEAEAAVAEAAKAASEPVVEAVIAIEPVASAPNVPEAASAPSVPAVVDAVMAEAAGAVEDEDEEDEDYDEDMDEELKLALEMSLMIAQEEEAQEGQAPAASEAPVSQEPAAEKPEEGKVKEDMEEKADEVPVATPSVAAVDAAVTASEVEATPTPVKSAVATLDKETPVSNDGAAAGGNKVALPDSEKAAPTTSTTYLLWVFLDGVDEPVSLDMKAVMKQKADKAGVDSNSNTAAAMSASPGAGVAAALTPKFPPATASTSSGSQDEVWTLGQFIEHVDRPVVWSTAVDAELVEMLNSLGDKHTCSPLDLLVKDFTTESVGHFPLLANVALPELHARFCLLKTFNQHVSVVLPFVDRQQAGSHQHSLGHAICSERIRRLIVHQIKKSYFDQLLEVTTKPTAPAEDPYDDPPSLKTLELNRHRAAKAAEVSLARPDEPPRSEHTLLGQAHKQLGSVAAPELRRAFLKFTDDGQTRTFKVKFTGEGVNDNGGPYRDCFNDFCLELQSRVLPLLIPSPNARQETGANRDKWIVNPGCHDLDMYRFVGRLMGVALRSKIYLNLALPSIVWKTLVQEPLTEADLEDVDGAAVSLAAAVRRKDPAILSSVPVFTCLLGDGVTEAELGPGGKHRVLTEEGVSEWARLMMKVRLHEADRQLAELRRGFGEVVPVALLPLLSWQEMERTVCGSPGFAVDLLRSVTRYEGKVTAELPYIKYFWQVLGDFSDAEKAQFLRFCWARTRCPVRAADFHTKFKIQEPRSESVKEPDKHLPHAHTCFFSIQLPPYTSPAVLRDRLTYAMWNCGTMNADVNLKDSELYNYHDDEF